MENILVCPDKKEGLLLSSNVENSLYYDLQEDKLNLGVEVALLHSIRVDGRLFKSQ